LQDQSTNNNTISKTKTHFKTKLEKHFSQKIEMYFTVVLLMYAKGNDLSIVFDENAKRCLFGMFSHPAREKTRLCKF
jgi:hypothetical protein